MKKVALLLALFVALSARALAQKQIYMPDTLKLHDFGCDTSLYSWRHSAQTQNLIILWERGYGDNPYAAPALDGHPMNFDLGNLMVRLEGFYRFYRDTLRFVRPGSIADRFKMMVVLPYSLEGTAYGGTYDDFIGALWVTPGRIQDERLNCLAHELGHSFQLQVLADKEGVPWDNGGFYEMTSQWMLWLVNPGWVSDENYHLQAFQKLTHRGFLHWDNAYHSPYVLQWWAERRGLACIGDLYREAQKSDDPVMTYKRKYGLSQQLFNDEIFDCYRHLVNFDFAHARRETRPYACTFDTPMRGRPGEWQSPDTACVPENYGFNAIRLEAPAPGTVLRADFRSEARAGDAGFRYGFVAVSEADACLYGEVGAKPSGQARIRIPGGVRVKALYFVVMGAPATHSADPSSRKFPYRVKFH